MTDPRSELITLIKSVMHPPAGSTQEHDDEVVRELQRRSPRPGVLDLIFHPERTEGSELLRGRSELDPEEIADLILAHRPIQL